MANDDLTYGHQGRDDQKKAALQERIAKLQQQVRRINRREENQARRARNHRLILHGTHAETHALKNPGSEYAQIHVGLLKRYVRPEDRHLFAEFFRALLPPAEAEALLAETPAPSETPEAAE